MENYMNKVTKRFKVTDGLLESLWLLKYTKFYSVIKNKYFDTEWEEDCYIIEISASSESDINFIINKAKSDVPFGTSRISEV